MNTRRALALMVIGTLVVGLVYLRGRVAENIVRFQSRHFGVNLDAGSVRRFVVFFAAVALLVLADRACR